LNRIANAWARGGVRLAARVILARIGDAIQERVLRIRSAGLIPIESLIPQWRDCHDYFPTTIGDFRRVLDDLPIDAEDVFVDYGCGKGRVLILAAAYRFAGIIGVEISGVLAAAARVNVDRALRADARARIDIVNCDARDFALPHEASVLYLYNPFHGDILRAVFEQVRRSLAAYPRRLYVIFNNPRHFEAIERDYPWLVRKRTYTFEHDVVVYEARVEITHGVSVV
jgi:SAM-dependent methyltransferase